MWLAIDAVKKGEADVAVSAGNTGALMAMAKFNLRTMPGIDRPAIAALWPTLTGEAIVLDVGASIGADAQHLVNLAVMGSAMARVLFDLDCPTVGLLNIGVEEVKGLEEVREAGRMLREAMLPDFNYIGFVEGTEIGTGRVDVVVTEGFAGNIAIKVAEGTARQLGQYLRSAMSRTWRAQVADDLDRQLAGRREDQRGGTCGGVLQALDQGNPEGERLARAGRRLREHVVPGEHVGDDQLLYGERRLDPTLGELIDYDLGHAEVGECFMLHVVGAPSGGPLAAAADGDSTDPIRAIERQQRQRTSRTTSPPVGPP